LMQMNFNRQEAAEYLRLSTRSLDRLRLPRTYYGAKPIYARADLDDSMQAARVVPTVTPPTAKRAIRPAKVRRFVRKPVGDDWLSDIRKARAGWAQSSRTDTAASRPSGAR
jgi:hypothetical protein